MAKYQSEYKYFNTTLTIVFESNNYSNVKVINEAIVNKANHLQHVFNFYDSNSELSKLNSNKNLVTDESNYDLLNIIEAAKKIQKLTHNYFNIDTTFQNEDFITINDNVITTVNDLDLGAIAKGYFLDWCSNLLNEYNENVFINFGGAVLSYRDRLRVGLRDPKNKDNNLLTVILNSKYSMHTSATYEQVNDNNLSHIYQHDLKDHYMANDNKSITVIDINSTLCDSLSTALFAMDINLALAFIKDNHVNAIVVDDDKIYIKEILMDNIILSNFDKEIVVI